MWLTETVSLYKTHSFNTGKPATFNDIFKTIFAKDLGNIIALRGLNRTAPDYKTQARLIKSKLQCFTPAALLASKATGNVIELHRTGMMQLDIDQQDIGMYDLEELKACIFSLPFIGYCGLSCSGLGFYALALIAEPERLSEYAQHCFNVLQQFGIKADTSKGKKVENLRYVSYDANALIRENPTALHLRPFKGATIHKTAKLYKYPTTSAGGYKALLTKELWAIEGVQVGERWQTVQKAGYTIGGMNTPAYLPQLISAIKCNSAFYGEEEKYIKCATDCYNAGMQKPMNTPTQFIQRSTAKQDFAEVLNIN